MISALLDLAVAVVFYLGLCQLVFGTSNLVRKNAWRLQR